MPALEYTVVEPVVFSDPDHRECVGLGHVWLVVTGEGWEAETLFSVWLMPGRSAVVRARGRIVIGTGSAADAVDTARVWLADALPEDFEIGWQDSRPMPRGGGLLMDVFSLWRPGGA